MAEVVTFARQRRANARCQFVTWEHEFLDARDSHEDAKDWETIRIGARPSFKVTITRRVTADSYAFPLRDFVASRETLMPCLR